MKNIIKIIPIGIILLLSGCSGSHSELYQSSNMQMKTPSGNLLSYVKDDIDSSCREGNTKDCEYLADYFYEKKDIKNVLKYAKIACNNGLEKACIFLDKYNQEYNKLELKKVQKQKAKKKNREDAILPPQKLFLYEENCKNGDGKACFDVSGHYMNLEVPNVYKASLALKNGCDISHHKFQSDCCMILGVLKTETDTETALKYLNKGCKLGNKSSCEYTYVLVNDIKAGRL